MMMKKTFKFLTLAMLLSFVGTVSALAQAIKGTTQWADDVRYEITAIRVLNGAVKEATVSVIDNATPKSGVTEVTIPGKVTLKVSGKTDNSVTVSAMDVEFTVTKIEKFGYANKNDVQKFNIPAEVEEIGADAFHNAASQTNTDLQIVFAAGSKLKKIGDCAFGNSAAKTIDLSNCNDLDLTGSKPFVNRGTGENNQLQKVILPEGIQNIGQAFAGLPKLTELDLSNTKVTVLEDGALANTGLTEVTIPAVTEPTVQTVKIGSKAFENSPVETLTINAPIVTQGALANDAFYGMKDLKNVYFNGGVYENGNIPANAFKDSSLEKVKFNKLGTGAISAEAFKDQSKLNSVAFNGEVAAGAIGANAFAGIATEAAECATVAFRMNLTGEAAIGANAFDGAAIKMLKFSGNLADKAISQYAFNKITCDAAVRFEGTLGAQAIGQYAFNEAQLQYVLFALAIDQEKAIDEYAFNEATIIGSDKFAVRFGGALNAQHSIGTRAFYQTDIQKDIIFAGDIAGKEAISGGAFSGFDNSLGGGVPVLFSGNISGENAIGAYAFQGGAVSTVTINGNVSGLNAIGDCAFYYCGNNTSSADAVYTMTSLVIKGEVSNTNAIGYQAFAGNLNLALIDLQGNIYAATAPAIAPEAFAYVGKNSGKLVVNFGPIKSSQAIFGAEAPAPSSRMADPAPVAVRGFGAFYGAVIDVVNFDKLMAEKAIADNQFGGATINTVNFNQEFKAWPEAENNAAENFVGWNAFTGTKVKTVNFNAPISVEYAIYAAPKAERRATSFNATYAAQSPFAENGAPMTINFNADVVENGIGAYAFSNSNTVAINLANDADFGMRAFRNWSFYGITWDGTAEKHVDINYDAPTGVTDRSFAQGAFYGSTTIVDIYFNTTKEVLALYTAENNANDLTPYRIKGIATKYIDVIQGPDGRYYGVFTPENEMYVIEKYQESGAEVGVWSAYADDLTLEATGEKFKANDRAKYNADLYINPLRVQDKGKYVLNAGHTLIITSSTADKVIAKQDLGAHMDGGVQTFAGLSPWACNDLRWNPAESNSNNWGGYVNWAAIDNGNKDIYGNEVRKYELFRQYDFATQGLGFGNSINIPEDQMYILVASLGENQVANRIKYSEYENNKGWFETNGITWEKSLFELIEDAQKEAAEGSAEDLEAKILEKINDMIEEAGGEAQETIEDALDELVAQKTKNIGDANLPDLKTAFVNALVATMKLSYDKGQMDAANENGDEYYLVQKLNEATGKWELAIYDPIEDYMIWDSDELPNGYRQVFPMGFPHIQGGFDQSEDSDAPFLPNTYDLEDNDQALDELTLFEDTNDEATYEDGNDIAAYEEWLKDLLDEFQGRILPDPVGDNFYDVYKARANGEFDDGFEEALAEAVIAGDVTEIVMPEAVSADLKNAAEKWQAVKDAYEELSDEALAYMALSVDERRTAWYDLDADLQDELRTFCNLLRAADDPDDQPSGFGWHYDEEVIAEQNAAIADYEEAVEAYNAEVQAAVRKAGAEQIAFKLYRKALVKNENAHGINYVDDERLEQAYPNFLIAKNNRKAYKRIDVVNGYLAHLQNSKVYQAFDALRQTVGTPSVAAVEDDPETEADETAEAIPATGDILALETAILALDETGKALYNALYGIEDTEEGEEAPARLNIIWNGNNANVTGIMEAVVNRTATKDGDNVIYNLNGMRVKNTGKGIFIQNGKKIIK